MSWYLAALKKYAVFSGRACRKEYWMFAAISTVISLVLFIADLMIGIGNEGAGLGILSGLYGLFVLLPTVGVVVRRLHDTGRSGWNLLFGFVPIAGPFIVLYFTVADSQPGTNKFGPNPGAMPTPMAMAA